jgi:hypothetical protein
MARASRVVDRCLELLGSRPRGQGQPESEGLPVAGQPGLGGYGLWRPAGPGGPGPGRRRVLLSS